MTRGFSVSHKMVLYRLTCPLVKKVASSLNAIRLTMSGWILVISAKIWQHSSRTRFCTAVKAWTTWMWYGHIPRSCVKICHTVFFAESLFPNCTVWSILMDSAIWLAAQQQCSSHFHLFWAVLHFLGSCLLPIQSSQTLRRHDKSLNGLVDLVLQTFDGLQLANNTLPSSLQPLFFAPVLIYHPWHTSICRRKIIH